MDRYFYNLFRNIYHIIVELVGGDYIIKTIQDFNFQWGLYNEKMNDYYESEDILKDIFGPLVDFEELLDKDVADIGAGNGRFTEVLAKYSNTVTSIEPAKNAMLNNKLRNNKFQNIIFDNSEIGKIKIKNLFDFVFCIGVLHHIDNMESGLKNLVESLKSGGSVFLWLYGREGNGIYLAFIKLLRIFTVKMSDTWLDRVSSSLVPLLKFYRFLCRYLKLLPMASYFNEHLDKFGNKELRLIIFDQLNPSVAFYLTKQQVYDLLISCGLIDIRLYHRHGYSWSVRAIRPEKP